MKKFYSTLFLFLFLLNSIGYYGFMALSQKQIVNHVQDKIDENVNDISGNLILRVPLSMPYPTTTEYKRIDGEINFDGELYWLVKQRIYNDTLYMVCLKDYETRAIKNMIHDYVKTFTDSTSHPKSGVKIFNTLAKDYLVSYSPYQTPERNVSVLSFDKQYTNHYYFGGNQSIFRPPLYLFA